MSEVKIIDLPEKVIAEEDFALVVDTLGRHFKALYKDIADITSIRLLESGEIADILNKASSYSATGRPVIPTSTPLSDDELIVQALQAGTYTNFGGLVVSPTDINGIVRLVKVNGVWSKDVKAVNSGLSDKIDNLPIKWSISTDGRALLFEDGNGYYSVALNNDGSLEATLIKVNNLEADIVNFQTLDRGSYIIGNTNQYELCIVDENDNVGYAVTLDMKVVQVEPIMYKPYPNVPSDVLHIISYGQSLSRGELGAPISTVAKYGSLAFKYGPLTNRDVSDVAVPADKYDVLIPLVETGWETPLSGAIELLCERILKENGLTNESQDLKFIASCPGKGGASLTTLAKGHAQNNYGVVISDVIAGLARANALGKTYNVPVIYWTQGETEQGWDQPTDTYVIALTQIFNDLNTDIKAITKQTNDVQFILYQIASYAQQSPTDYPYIALAHAKIAEQMANVHCVVPAYIFDYVDNLHLNAVSTKWMGAYYGLTAKRVVFDNETFKPLAPKSITAQKNIIEVTFNVPYGRLVFDTDWVTNPGNYGFRVVNASNAVQTITSVSIVRDDTVRIIMSTDLTAGSKLQYGINSSSGSGRIIGARGNLRDTQGDVITFSIAGTDKPLHNWCQVFDKIIN